MPAVSCAILSGTVVGHVMDNDTQCIDGSGKSSDVEGRADAGVGSKRNRQKVRLMGLWSHLSQFQ